MTNPRVAILGVRLAGNAAAPVVVEADLRRCCWLEGDAILRAARAHDRVIRDDVASFVSAMDATGPWQPVPILLAGADCVGPAGADLMDALLAQLREGLGAAGPLDAVFLANHGAMTAAQHDDPDGEMIALVRAIAGPGARIVVSLDLNANISDQMVANADLVIGPRTAPSCDHGARAEEAAMALRLMLAGEIDPKSATVRLPLAPVPQALLTAHAAMGDLIAFGQRRQSELAGGILNVSIFGGFVFADAAKAGMAIVVTARRDEGLAGTLAGEIAERAWSSRSRFLAALTPLKRAIAMAKETNREPVIFADAGDDPGSGGTGRTTEVLSALVWAGAEDLLIGSFHDPPLAAHAHQAGIGAHIHARFNSHAGQTCDGPFEVDAEVVGLHDGMIAGCTDGAQRQADRSLGAGAALRIGGIVATIFSQRIELDDPLYFELFGLEIGKAHTVVVKSGGRFRAGFSGFFAPQRFFDLDSDGLTSAVLQRRKWTKLPRPLYPLDEDATWTPPADGPTVSDIGRRQPGVK